MPRRKPPQQNPNTNAATLRALIARIERAVDMAPPHKAAALIPRLAPLVERLVDARAAEEARRAREDENALRIAFDDEAPRLIDERALEFAQVLLNPPDWELDNRAKQIARSEGGAWRDHLPRVRAEHAAFIERLLNPKPARAYADAQDGAEESRNSETWMEEGADR